MPPSEREVVVKSTLRKYLHGHESAKDRIIEAVEKRVRAYSARAHLGSTLVLGIVKDLLRIQGNDQVRDAREMVVPPALFTDTFMFQAFSTAGDLHPLIQTHLNAHPHLRNEEPRYLSDTNIYAYGSQMYLTNLKNSLWMNLEARVRAFFRAYADSKEMTKIESAYIVACAMGYSPNSHLCLRQETAALVDAHRVALQVEEAPRGRNDPAWDVTFATVSDVAAHGERAKDRVFARAFQRSGSRGLPDKVARKVGHAIGCRVMGWSHPARSPPLEPDDVQWCEQAREAMGLAPGVSYDTDRHLPLILRYYAFQNQERERLELPLFNIVPVCDAKRHFVRLDTLGIHGVMRDAGLVRCSKRVFSALGSDHWASLLKLRKLLGVGRAGAFTELVDTDGIGLCTHFKRPVNDTAAGDAAAAYVPRPTDRLLGIDPGRVNIFTVVEEVSDGVYRNYRMTRGQYYAEGGINESNRKSALWHGKGAVRSALRAASAVSSKGASPDAHAAFLVAHAAFYRDVLDEHMKPRWARQRLRLYGGKQRVVHRFFERIRKDGEPGRRIVVAYGASGHASGGPGEMSVPTVWAFKACCQAFLTYKEDEFRSTATNWKDGRVLEKVRDRRSGTVSRDLLWAAPPPPLSGAKGRFVDRDVNAAINILRCFKATRVLGGERPAAMCRKTPNLPPIPKKPTKSLRITRR